MNDQLSQAYDIDNRSAGTVKFAKLFFRRHSRISLFRLTDNEAAKEFFI